MIIVDTELRRRAGEGDPVTFGMFGAGFMAKGILNQQRSTSGWRCAAVCNRTIEHAVDALREAGITDVDVVDTISELDRAISAGATAVTADPRVLLDSELLPCVVEATGHVEYGAHVTVGAIESGKHVVLMNAELDGTVGPLLTDMARSAGVIVTGCDGDQPGVQLNLYRFVESLGLEPLLCGNIKGLQDHYRTPTTQAGFAAQWGQTPSMVTSFADGTKISFEQAVVANATGMTVARRGMLGIEHDGHVDELVGLFDVDDLRRRGGIVDYVIGAAPSPGVFILAAAHDATQRHYLDYGKLGKGPLYSFYVPYHLTVLEVPLSVARVVLFDDPVIQPTHGPVVDVVTVAKRDLATGQTLDGLGGYDTYGVCETHTTTRRDGLLPIGLAEGSVLRRPVARDEVLCHADVDPPAGSLVHELRARQDDLFADRVAR